MRKIKAAFLPAVFLSGIITSSAQNNDIKPGGVDDAVLWHRADMGIDNTGNASTLYKWKDQVVGSIAGATKINVHINTYPSYYIGEYGNSFNFNPFIKFTHIRFKESSTLGDISARPLAGASAADHFSVTYSASYEDVTLRDSRIFSMDYDPPLDRYDDFSFDYLADNGVQYFSRSQKIQYRTPTHAENNWYEIGHLRNNYSVNINKFSLTNSSNSLGVQHNGRDSSARQRGVKSNIIIPNGWDISGVSCMKDCYGNSRGHNFSIGENILFKRNLNDTETRQVNSYLAVKYGMTLSQPQNYIASDGVTVTWNADLDRSFNNNIFGLALDKKTGLNQKVSKSHNNTPLILATDNDFTSSNISNRTSFAQDKTFFMFGDNNNTSSSLVNFSSGIQRIQRIWLTQKTDNVGPVWIKFNLSDYSAVREKIGNSNGNNKVFLLTADDKDFSRGIEVFDPESSTGNDVIYKYDLPGNRYMTFAVGDHYAFNPVNRICVKSPAAGTPNEYTKVGVTTYRTPQQAWPVKIPNGFIALESSAEGLVITRTTAGNITSPIEGMLIFDTTDRCFKLYNGANWNCIRKSCND